MGETSNVLILECRGLRKSYGDRLAVDGVGFSIAQGETYGLLGPNGAGKTTTMLVREGAGLADILPQLAVLGGFAVALLALATWRLQRAIVG